MARCPAHGNRIQRTPSGAVNLFGATPQTDCRRTESGATVLSFLAGSSDADPMVELAYDEGGSVWWPLSTLVLESV